MTSDNAITLAKSLANSTGHSWWLITFVFDDKLYRHVRRFPDLSDYPKLVVVNEIKPDKEGTDAIPH